MFPWKCAKMLLNGLVRDAAPSNNSTFTHTTTLTSQMDNGSSSEDEPSGVDAVHQQLARRVSNSERKP